MGFYLRKSIRVGPFKFNLSKSGIGVSTGIPGFRIGMGQRGNYVHMGRGGLYYRATLPSSSTPSSPPHSHKLPDQESAVFPPIPIGTHAPLEEIESAHISQLVDSSSRGLLEELNNKKKKMWLWPLVAIAALTIFIIGASSGLANWALILVLLLGAISAYLVYTLDTLGKSVVLFYDFDPEMESVYEQLHEATSQLADSAGVWHIEASGDVYDQKYHAGANSIVSRNKTFIRKEQPQFVKTNIETVAMGVGRQTLYFFPDRVLVYDKDGVGAVNYKDLRVKVESTRFVEESGSVPQDADVVGQTWRYVNKSGGPDRRFKDNSELPICLYEEIVLSSQTGLNEVLQLSRCGGGDDFAKAVSSLVKKLPKEFS